MQELDLVRLWLFSLLAPRHLVFLDLDSLAPLFVSLVSFFPFFLSFFLPGSWQALMRPMITNQGALIHMFALLHVLDCFKGTPCASNLACVFWLFFARTGWP